MANIIGGVIGLTLSVIMVSNVLIPTFNNTNTTGWDTQSATIFGLSVLVAAAGLVYSVAAFFGML